MEQVVYGVVLSIVAVVFLAVLGCARAPTDERPPRLRSGQAPRLRPIRLRSGRQAASRGTERVRDAGYAEDEGWVPDSLGPVAGYARLWQGGRLVGYAAMHRLHLPPGWEAGRKGMRPYTKRAREEWEQSTGGGEGVG